VHRDHLFAINVSIDMALEGDGCGRLGVRFTLEQQVQSEMEAGNNVGSVQTCWLDQDIEPRLGEPASAAD
jgi:hypothetical protein